ncbi:hypothetical protein IB257_30090 [Achromobacter sp. ACM03]|uniref:hypothetical protein n=1 Tax=Achromobacter sp. ACM03 TaxID=2769300 RepID=UPI001786BEDF|nr:hypothetical protein [Achromobacter sp. ACM03]MBD9434209.1 hypothetical protein [Achromobacter sp. ACM03]
MIVERQLTVPPRVGLTTDQLWNGEDGGLIACWERGREVAREQPELAKCAQGGELVALPWRGGVEAAVKGKKYGSHRYVAMWLGLRACDLFIDSESQVEITCAKHGTKVIFLSDAALWDALPD